MNGFDSKIGFYDIFSRFAAGFVFILNLFLITIPFISLDDVMNIFSKVSDKVEFLIMLIVVALSYVLGIALAPLGVLLGHLLFHADIEHAIEKYMGSINEGTEKLHWKRLMSLLQKNFGTDLSLRSYLNVVRARLKEECLSATDDIDRLNATSIMMRSMATAELLTFIAAFLLLITTLSNFLFYIVLFICSGLLCCVLFYQSIKTQGWWVGQVFETYYAMNISSLDPPKLPSNVFRANVGMIILNEEGKVLALERSDKKGAWQLPQGGIEEYESPLEAAVREIKEETNLTQKNLQLVSEHPEWLAYELPLDKRSEKHGRGQVQKWFVFRLSGYETSINLEQTGEQEFSSWEWMTLPHLIKKTIHFRQSIYEKLADCFSQYLAECGNGEVVK